MNKIRIISLQDVEKKRVRQKVVFVSRHEVSPEQKEAIVSKFGEVEIECRNVVLHSPQDIREIVGNDGVEAVIAVFPAWMVAGIAYEYGFCSPDHEWANGVFIPVSIPVPAGDDGKPRGFQHSHFVNMAGRRAF